MGKAKRQLRERRWAAADHLTKFVTCPDLYCSLELYSSSTIHGSHTIRQGFYSSSISACTIARNSQDRWHVHAPKMRVTCLGGEAGLTLGQGWGWRLMYASAVAVRHCGKVVWQGAHAERILCGLLMVTEDQQVP